MRTISPAILSVSVAAAIGGGFDVRCAKAVPSVASPPTAGIRAGETTFDLPAVAAIVTTYDPGSETGGSLCTGTLIGCQTVLTAGHCVCLDRPETCCLSIYPVRDCQPLYDIPAGNILVFFQHGGLAAASSVAIAGDLALITLKEPVTGIVPAQVNRESRPEPGASAMIAGFGVEGFVHSAPLGAGIKRAASVTVGACRAGWDDSFLCSTASTEDDPGVCPGDSGGPLLVDLGAGPMVAGTLSFGAPECVPPYDGIFSAVLPWRSFLETAAGDDLGRARCGDLPAVGAAGVTIHTFDGELTSTVDEIRGDFEVAPETAVLRVTLNGVLRTDHGRNNFDLFVEQEGASSTPICSDTNDLAIGACEIVLPSAGSWHVRARRITGSGEVQLTATLFGGRPTPTPSPSPPAIQATGTTGSAGSAGGCQVGSSVPAGGSLLAAALLLAMRWTARAAAPRVNHRRRDEGAGDHR
jgi:Trypsin